MLDLDSTLRICGACLTHGDASSIHGESRTSSRTCPWTYLHGAFGGPKRDPITVTTHNSAATIQC